MANGDNLPNGSITVLPFDPITAQWANDINANILSLAGGTGFDDGAIDTNALAESAVTASKIDRGTVVQSGSMTSNVGGYTSARTTNLSYVKLLNIVICSFTTVTGTSNSGSVTMELPFNPDSTSRQLMTYVRNNGSVETGPGLMTITANNKIADIRRDTGGLTFTASGTKDIGAATFIYSTDE